MSKPEDVSQEAWDAAERPSLRVQLDFSAQQLWDIRPTIARAIMAAEKRGEEREREACIATANAERVLPFYVEPDTATDSDKVYDMAIDHVCDAIRNMTAS